MADLGAAVGLLCLGILTLFCCLVVAGAIDRALCRLWARFTRS